MKQSSMRPSQTMFDELDGRPHGEARTVELAESTRRDVKKAIVRGERRDERRRSVVSQSPTSIIYMNMRLSVPKIDLVRSHHPCCNQLI